MPITVTGLSGEEGGYRTVYFRNDGTVPVRIRVRTLPGTATNADFEYFGSSVVNTTNFGQPLGPGQTGDISILIRSDNLVEGPETFSILYTVEDDSGNVLEAETSVTYTINDPSSSFSITSDVVQAEGDGDGVSFFDFTVTRTGTSGTASVDYSITGSGSNPATLSGSQADLRFGSAQAGSATSTGLIAQTGTVNFSDGQSTATIRVPVSRDFVIEGNETFSVTLSNPVNAVVSSSGTGTGTITNDDAAGTISVADVSVGEGDSASVTGYFSVTRSNGLAATSVSYTVGASGSAGDTTATPGADYAAAASGTVSFAAGQTTALVPFQVLGDTLVERNETFRISLSNPTNGSTISRGTATATIIDNDVTSGTQFGTSGNDTLIAQTTGAILVGEGGNDTYLVNSSSDQVIEQTGGGTDIVYTTVSYNLGVNEVEALSVANQMTTNAINLIGNYASQTIVGNYGDNVLNGGSGGVDTLIGLFGNDTYAVGDSRTVVVEQAGQGFDTLVTSVSYTLAAGVSVELFTAQDRGSTTGLRLIGNEVSQTIAGTAGNDTISGGGGADVLIGGAGADRFDFTTALGTGNVATLADFAAGTDRIGLSSGIFAGVGSSLDAGEFVVGTAATAANAQVVYNQSTGQLFYDADGTGSGAAVHFAQLAPGTVLTTASFEVVPPITALAV